MTNVVFVVSHAALVCAEPVGGGEGDFLKPCLQTDPADCFAFTASSPEGKKGLVLVSFTSHGERDAFPQGNGQDSNWREESRVRCMMTNAPGAQDLPCRVNKELQNPLGSEPCLTCCGHHQSHTVLKLCQVETLPHFSTLSSSVELEQSMPTLTFYLLSVCGGGYRL